MIIINIIVPLQILRGVYYLLFTGAANSLRPNKGFGQDHKSSKGSKLNDKIINIYYLPFYKSGVPSSSAGWFCLRVSLMLAVEMLGQAVGT